MAAKDYAADLGDILERSLRELKIAVRGLRILLKPNLIESRQGAPIHTDPSVVIAAIDALRRLDAAEVVVGEGPGHSRDSDHLLDATGLRSHLRSARVPFVDLNHDDVEMVTLKSRFTGQVRVALPVSVLKADLVVSMPKLKTHHWAGMTCAMKNLFGVVPGAVYGWPKNPLHYWGIDNSIVDLAATVRPGLAIVDAVVAMEGDGPIMGRPRELGCLVAGSDLVAVDATCARLIGFDPDEIGYLKAAGDFLGHARGSRIDQRGELIERFATVFERAPSAAGEPRWLSRISRYLG